MYTSRGPNGAGPPLEFDTGVDAVPEAVDMCIRLMTPTEVASVTAAPKYAYQGRTDRPEVDSYSVHSSDSLAQVDQGKSHEMRTYLSVTKD